MLLINGWLYGWWMNTDKKLKATIKVMMTMTMMMLIMMLRQCQRWHYHYNDDDDDDTTPQLFSKPPGRVQIMNSFIGCGDLPCYRQVATCHVIAKRRPANQDVPWAGVEPAVQPSCQGDTSMSSSIIGRILTITMLEEKHEREWVTTSDVNDFSNIVDSKHISNITNIV